MTDLVAIRAAIIAEMAAVPNIGRLHDYERYAQAAGDFREFYIAEIDGSQQLRGWYVRRLTTTETSAVMGSHEDSHEWLLRGFMALDDANASEKVFDGQIEAVRARFRDNPTLGGLIASVYSPKGEGPKLVESLPVMFGGVLCHSARIQLTTWYAF